MQESQPSDIIVSSSEQDDQKISISSFDQQFKEQIQQVKNQRQARYNNLIQQCNAVQKNYPFIIDYIYHNCQEQSDKINIATKQLDYTKNLKQKLIKDLEDLQRQIDKQQAILNGKKQSIKLIEKACMEIKRIQQDGINLLQSEKLEQPQIKIQPPSQQQIAKRLQSRKVLKQYIKSELQQKNKKLEMVKAQCQKLIEKKRKFQTSLKNQNQKRQKYKTSMEQKAISDLIQNQNQYIKKLKRKIQREQAKNNNQNQMTKRNQSFLRNSVIENFN